MLQEPLATVTQSWIGAAQLSNGRLGALWTAFFFCLLLSGVVSEESKQKDSPPKKFTAGDLLEACGNTTQVPYYPLGNTTSYWSEHNTTIHVRDRCQKSKSLGDRLLVTTTHTETPEDVAWIPKDINIPFLVYYSGIKKASHNHPNVANEAMGYLTFIAEYYKCLPKVTLFAHPHKSSYHTHYDLDKALEHVIWENITGFAMLHPFGAAWADFNLWDPLKNLEGKNESLDKLPDPPECFFVINNTLYEYWSRWEFRRAQWVSRAFDAFFTPAGLGKVPERIRCATTAEFFVTRERIHLRPRRFYLQLREWLIEAEKSGFMNYWELGVVMELLWHYIFGEPAYMKAPTLDPCDLYHCQKTLASSQ